MREREDILRRYDLALARAEEATLCGVDEVGRGPLAGPVVAAAVLLPDDARIPGLDDSKRLTARRRTDVALAIRACALGLGVAFVGPRHIERANIRQASLLAMRRAVLRAERTWPSAVRADAPVVLVLVDGIDLIPGLARRQRAVVAGDASSRSIAAASVVAKTARDGFMARLASEFPAYGFDRNFGYGTAEHLRALARVGPCPWHRRTFAPIAQRDLLAELEPA